MMLVTLNTALSRLPQWTPVAFTGGVLGIFVVLAFCLPVDHESYYVAFAGNNYLANNDMPRLLQAMGGSKGNIHQESCIHPSGSISSIMSTGNGMKNQWHTVNAQLSLSDSNYYYDYGVCTVRQLLLGYDSTFMYNNYNAAYEDDGENPCFESQNYFNYVSSTLDNTTHHDYFFLADQTKRMALQEYRDDAIYSLMNDYVPLLKVSGAVPIIVANHAFWSYNSNMTGLDDVATFTSLIYEGARQYATTLDKVLTQKSKIAPVGLAYLAIYEDNKEMWNLLTASDDIHASVYGSFLCACVLYATMTGAMPDKAILADVKSLYNEVRLVKGEKFGYPNADQARYLWKMARRVTIEARKPSTFETFGRR